MIKKKLKVNDNNNNKNNCNNKDNNNNIKKETKEKKLNLHMTLSLKPVACSANFECFLQINDPEHAFLQSWGSQNVSHLIRIFAPFLRIRQVKENGGKIQIRLD